MASFQQDDVLSKSANAQTLSSCLLRERVYDAADFQKDPGLADRLTKFINDGFLYSGGYSADRWEASLRLDHPKAFEETVGKDGLVVILYHEDEPVACACVIPWHGDMKDFARPGESGWEVKMVTVEKSWTKRGLAGKCIDILKEELLSKEDFPKDSRLQLWIQVVDDIVGDYWRRRGWRDDRSYEFPTGLWGAKYDWRLAVLVKEFDITPKENATQ